MDGEKFLGFCCLPDTNGNFISKCGAFSISVTIESSIKALRNFEKLKRKSSEKPKYFWEILPI
jgi:hypothetical protein